MSNVPFYSQLYRNLVFSMHMSKELGVRWGLVSLVSEKQFQQRQRAPEFQDPTPLIDAVLPATSRDQFLCYSWERLFSEHVAPAAELRDLAEYMSSKSANGESALAI